jgi:polyhydroxyalkanoate synthesis regulator phasin
LRFEFRLLQNLPSGGLTPAKPQRGELMEELLKKIVNLGIGAAKGLEDNLQTAFKAAEQGINDLVSKGDSSGDEASTRVKKFVNDLLVSVKDYEAKAKEMSENLTSALKEFQTSGKGRAEELQKRIEEITQNIRARIPGQA